RDDVVNAMKLAKNFGLRVHEATFLTKQNLRDTLKNGYLHLEKTKNTIMRDVPIENEQQREAIKEVLVNAKNERIFISHNQTYKKATESIKDWIYNNRDKFQDKNVIAGEREKTNLTYHGLRHKYAREQYHNHLKNGLTERQARIQVSHKLGHGRDEVTKVYL